MAKKFWIIAILSLLLVAFIAVNMHAAKAPGKSLWQKRADYLKNSRAKLAGAEVGVEYSAPPAGNTHSLGADVIISLSPGIQVGLTTYDNQSNTRMNRQIDWRGTQVIHFAWMHESDSLTGEGSIRTTHYEAWDPDIVDFIFKGPGGGCEIHAAAQRSGYVGLDISDGGGVIIGNHHNDGAGWAGTVWYDFAAASCFFSPGRRKLDDTLMQFGCNATDIGNGSWRFIWPQIEYQTYGADSVTHMFAHVTVGVDVDQGAAYVHYYRRVGYPFTPTPAPWDYPPMIVDTIPTINQSVSASRISGKVVLAWAGGPGNYPGDPESVDRYERIDDGLGHAQRTSDLYMMTSGNMGVDWGAKSNVTAYDSSIGGWLLEGDLSVLVDDGDVTHIVYSAREAIPFPGWLGDWTNFFGSRLFHWDEFYDEHRPIKDGNWLIDDSSCTGGAFANVNLIKPMISQCDGKFYVLFTQFNDGPNGIQNDCAEDRFSGSAGWSGTANGELYISVSDNGGRHWDVARNLTQTYTPHCYPNEEDGSPVCESDRWASMARFGLQITDYETDFEGVPIVDPSEGSYAGNHYLPVMYINDKFPGACVQDAGVWTTNPVKWFNVACIDPVTNPVLIYSPTEIGPPTWTHPGRGQLDTLVVLENTGNAELVVDSIVTAELNGPNGWLGVSDAGPISISHISPTKDTITAYLNHNGVITITPSVVNGYIIIYSTSVGGDVDSIPIELIVADTLMFPEIADVRTECMRISFSNAGQLGNGGGPGGNGGYNLNFFDDCDTTNNTQGEDHHAGVYLYEASPFLAYINSYGDTVLNSAMFDATWLSNDGFRPLAGPIQDSVLLPKYQYGYSGLFVSKDSAIALECEILAPSDPDTCTFIISIMKIYLTGTDPINDIYIGDFADWDIPSDSGTENGSGFDANDKLMYMYGGEYGPEDTLPNNDCVLADQRYGGIAYYGGYAKNGDDNYAGTTIPQAMWTHMNADWVYPEGGFVPELMYQKLAGTFGYQPWASTNPTLEDSLYQDLHMVINFGQYSLTDGDTLIFIKIYASEYDGGLVGLQETIQKAKAWFKKLKRLWVPIPPDPIAGDIGLDNTDGYKPADGNPIGSAWHETWPNYCDPHTLTSWIDNGDGILSACDTVDFDGNDSLKYHVEWVGPTIVGEIIGSPDTVTLDYLDYEEYPNPDVNDLSIDDIMLSYWYEVNPDTSNKYVVIEVIEGNNNNDTIDFCDTLILKKTGSGEIIKFHVDHVATDIIIKEALAICDCEPGNANGDVNTNIFDVTYMISYLYKGGPEPTPYPVCSGDPNGLGCTCNIFDVTYLISYLYKGGPSPVTCEEWLAACGPPLR